MSNRPADPHSSRPLPGGRVVDQGGQVVHFVIDEQARANALAGKRQRRRSRRADGGLYPPQPDPSNGPDKG